MKQDAAIAPDKECAHCGCRTRAFGISIVDGRLLCPYCKSAEKHRADYQDAKDRIMADLAEEAGHPVTVLGGSVPPAGRANPADGGMPPSDDDPVVPMGDVSPPDSVAIGSDSDPYAEAERLLRGSDTAGGPARQPIRRTKEKAVDGDIDPRPDKDKGKTRKKAKQRRRKRH